ncbi:hypothetical protein Amsp01_086740 [Amycolatopsis sp. NBRC 101858]|nr:hypothetical protein Amsp01_086740 [Amycolatopsis sp. NBRC 101858]
MHPRAGAGAGARARQLRLTPVGDSSPGTAPRPRSTPAYPEPPPDLGTFFPHPLSSGARGARPSAQSLS